MPDNDNNIVSTVSAARRQPKQRHAMGLIAGGLGLAAAAIFARQMADTNGRPRRQ